MVPDMLPMEVGGTHINPEMLSQVSRFHSTAPKNQGIVKPFHAMAELPVPLKDTPPVFV
jgi:hypothetical protein